MILNNITTQNPEPAPKKFFNLQWKGLFNVEKLLAFIKSNIQEFDSFIKENQRQKSSTLGATAPKLKLGDKQLRKEELTISVIQQKVLQTYLHLQIAHAAKGTPTIS